MFAQDAEHKYNMKLVVFLSVIGGRYYLSKNNYICHSEYPNDAVEDKFNFSKDISCEDMKWITLILEMGYFGSTVVMILDKTHGLGSFNSKTIVNLFQKLQRVTKLTQILLHHYLVWKN